MAYGVGERHPEVELARLVPILRVAVRAHGEVARPWLQPQRGRPLHVERVRNVGHRRAWFGIGLGLGSEFRLALAVPMALAVPAQARRRFSHGSTLAATKRSKACSSASSPATWLGLGLG